VSHSIYQHSVYKHSLFYCITHTCMGLHPESLYPKLPPSQIEGYRVGCQWFWQVSTSNVQCLLFPGSAFQTSEAIWCLSRWWCHVTENVSANLQCIENYSVNEEPRQKLVCSWIPRLRWKDGSKCKHWPLPLYSTTCTDSLLRTQRTYHQRTLLHNHNLKHNPQWLANTIMNSIFIDQRPHLVAVKWDISWASAYICCIFACVHIECLKM
jgi:hypothetical protein